MAVKIGVAKETAGGERRVALTPETCGKLGKLGAEVIVERGLGRGAHFPDDAYAAAGATLVDDAASALSDADLVFCIQPPDVARIALMKPGAALIGGVQPEAGIDHHHVTM